MQAKILCLSVPKIPPLEAIRHIAYTLPTSGPPAAAPSGLIAQTPLRNCFSGADAMSDIFISPTDLNSLLQGNEPPLILDLRKRPAFVESGFMLSGAIWRDPFEIAQWIDSLQKDTPIIVHCVHGHEVSQDAGKALREAGYNARVLEGGFEDWREAGFEVVPARDNEGVR
jgi:thiosulfate sulfurtransferase